MLRCVDVYQVIPGARRLDVLEPLLDVAERLIGFDGRE